MTDQHQGGHRGSDNRGGYSGGPRRGGAGKPAGRRDGRSSGGYSKNGPRKFGSGKPSGDRGGYAGGKPSGDRGGYRDGKPYGDRPRNDRRDGGSRDGKPYKKFDKKFDGSKGERREGGSYKKSGDKPYGNKGKGGFDRAGGKGGAPRGGRNFGGPKKFDRPRDDRSFDKRSFEKRDGAPAEEAKSAPITNPRAAARFGRAPEAEAPKPERRPERADRAPRDDRGPRNDRGGAPRNGGRGGAPRGRGQQRTVLSPGRKAACEIGRIVREREAFVADVTPSVLAKYEGISAEDAAFATKIARGVTATLGTLDEFINRNMKSPDDIEADVRDAMRVSAYELLYLGKDAYAAVDQGVELVRSVEPKASALANAVLRKMSQSARKFPYGNPDLSLSVLARSQAFPEWLARRLMNEMGLKQATDFMRACNADAPVFIAVNAIKANDADVVEIFDQAGSLMEPSDKVPGCYLVKESRVLRKPEVRALFENGSVCVADEAAQAVAALACPNADVETFLEIGAGRGTKTILMQSDAVRAFGRTIPMVSVDDHAFKSDVLAKRVAAYGIQSVRPVTADARTLSESLPEASFDAVFVDAPCSGLGTLRRHPEIRWRLTPEQIAELASLGFDLLAEAAKMVKPGGALTYATCTVFPEENEQVIERFRATDLGAEFEIEQTLVTTLSAAGSDAHYAVRMRRAAKAE